MYDAVFFKCPIAKKPYPKQSEQTEHSLWPKCTLFSKSVCFPCTWMPNTGLVEAACLWLLLCRLGVQSRAAKHVSCHILRQGLMFLAFIWLCWSGKNCSYFLKLNNTAEALNRNAKERSAL